jgi:hypothetical protein
MSARDVRTVLGDPRREGRNERGELDQSWGDVSIRYSVDRGQVVEVGLNPPAIAQFAEGKLFELPDPIALLQLHDPNPMEYLGFVVFLNLGLTLTGLEDADNSQRAVTAFARGRWDQLVPKMRPLNRPGPRVH